MAPHFELEISEGNSITLKNTKHENCTGLQGDPTPEHRDALQNANTHIQELAIQGIIGKRIEVEDELGRPYPKKTTVVYFSPTPQPNA